LDTIEKVAKAGVTTEELDALAEELTLKRDAKPAYKGYRGFQRVSVRRLMMRWYTGFRLRIGFYRMAIC